mgnify:CR=1 FL=1
MTDKHETTIDAGILQPGTIGDGVRIAEAALFPIVETAEGRVRGIVSGAIGVLLRTFRPLPGSADDKSPPEAAPVSAPAKEAA